MVGDCIRLIEEAEEGGAVTLSSLSRKFDSAAWAELQDENSRLGALLRLPAFSAGDGQIDVNCLKCFALLLCRGENQEKAEALLDIISGGVNSTG